MPKKTQNGSFGYDIRLTASVAPEGGPETLVADTNFKHM